MLQLVTRFLSFGVNRKFIVVLHGSTADCCLLWRVLRLHNTERVL